MEYVLYVLGSDGKYQEDCSSTNIRELKPIKRYFEREGKTVIIRKSIWSKEERSIQERKNA